MDDTFIIYKLLTYEIIISRYNYPSFIHEQTMKKVIVFMKLTFLNLYSGERRNGFTGKELEVLLNVLKLGDLLILNITK